MEKLTADSTYLSKLFDESVFEVERLARAGEIPRVGRGLYDVALCVKAYIKYLKDPDRTVSSQVMGGYLGVTSRTIELHARDGTIPRERKGRYALRPGIKAYLEYWVKLSEGGDKTLTGERTRLTRFQADNEEMKKKQLSGELFKADIVMNLWGRHIMDCRSRLLALPTKISPVAFACKTIQEVQAATEKLVYEALNELKNITVADYSKDISSNVDDDKDERKPEKNTTKAKDKKKPKKTHT